LERPVVVALFNRGELQSVRALSPQRERWAALVAGSAGAALVLGAMALAVGLLHALGLVVHAPTFFISWLGVAAAVAVVSARWARNRAGRYRLGADIEADAFAMHEVDFVRRAGADYEVGLVPGMSGSIEQGGRSVPIEALTQKGEVHVPLPAAGKVRLEAGRITFVIARRASAAVAGGSAVPSEFWSTWLGWLAQGTAKRLVRAAALGTPIAALATMLGAVPAALAVTENDGRWAIPGNATPLEVEKYIQVKAQLQSPELHQCFDTLPLACQRPGYVGVGLSLGKNGDVLSHWISRSTYGEDCPVTSCMEKVVSTWSFEPMRERMNVVIPVQVKRTRKPLWQSDKVEFSTPDPDAGANAGTSTSCADSDSGAVPLF
jgi:hypothetical protein